MDSYLMIAIIGAMSAVATVVVGFPIYLVFRSVSIKRAAAREAKSSEPQFVRRYRAA